MADSKMKSFEQEMKKALQEYQDHKKVQENKLEENRREQEGLRQRLAQLEGEERGLVSELQEGEAQDSKAEAVKKGVAKDIEEWRGNIAELKDQASTSLQVMTEMSGTHTHTSWLTNKVILLTAIKLGGGQGFCPLVREAGIV